MEKRKTQVSIISDVHLGTYGCHANELVTYLRGIEPDLLILNGDIIDIWQFSKRYFPASHMQVIKEIFSLLSKGTRIFYITGNHDETLRKYSGLELGNFKLVDKLVLDIDGAKTWIFHGDVFDSTTKGSAKIIAKLGGHGYDLLILINRGINWLLNAIGKDKMSFSKKIKNGVKQAVSWITNFEQTAAELAIEKGYEYVICGHIHQPQYREIKTDKGIVTYLNSGDWVENLTALEFMNGRWNIHYFNERETPITKTIAIKNNKEINLPDVFPEEISLFVKSLYPAASR